MKRVILLIGAMLVLILTNEEMVQADTNVTEENQSLEIKLKLNDNRMLVNGIPHKIEENPYLDANTTLVPLRAIVTALGVNVDWDSVSQMITLDSGTQTIKLTINSKEAIVNDERKTMTAAPRIISSTTMVPMRFISENFGASVKIDKDTEVITIQGSSISANPMTLEPVTYTWETIIQPVWDDVEPMKNYYKVRNSDGNYGLYDKSGKKIFEPKFNDFAIISDSKALAIRINNNRKEFINEQGKVVFSISNDFEVGEFVDEQSIIYEDERLVIEANGVVKNYPRASGVIGEHGMVIPMDYNYIFRDDTKKDVEYLVTTLKGKVLFRGALDRNGKIIAPLKEVPNKEYYIEAELSDDFHVAVKMGKFGAVTKSGKIVIPFEYDMIDSIYTNDLNTQSKMINNVFRVQKNGEYGLVDGNGKVIAPVEYTLISTGVNEGKMLVEKGIVIATST